MIEYSHGPVLWQSVAAVLIFGVSYLLILADVWNRTWIALSGALLLVLLGAVPLKELFQTYINWELLVLVLGVYLTTVILQKMGFVQYAALKLIQATGVKPISMLIVLAVIAAAGAGLFDGALMMIALIPFTLTTAKLLKIPVIPFAITVMLACGIGSSATLPGNMPNRMIGASANLSYLDFVIKLGPLMFILLLLLLLAVRFLYGTRFIISDALKKELMQLKPAEYLTDRTLLVKESVAYGIVLIGFLLHNFIGVKVAYVSIIGSLLIIIVDYKDVIQWVRRKDIRLLGQGVMDSQLLFLFGLLAMAGALVHSGIAGYAAARALEITQGSIPFTSQLILWLSGIGSATLEQVPYTAMFIPFIHETGAIAGISDPEQLQPLWWSLAIGAGIGGSGTLIGSYTNVLAAGMIWREQSRPSYWDYFKVAFPLAIIMLLISSVYMNLFFY